MLAINDCEDTVDLAILLYVFVLAECVDDRPRICHTSGLDQNAIKHRTWIILTTLFNVGDDVFDGTNQIIAHGATQTTIVQNGDRFDCIRFLDRQQLIIDRHVAELILDHGIFFSVLGGQNVIQQRRFTRSQKTSQYGNWYLTMG